MTEVKAVKRSKPHKPISFYEPADEANEFRQEVTRRLRVVDPKAADRYEQCHREGHGWVKYCSHDDAHYIHFIPFSCMLRICPTCAERLSQRVKQKYSSVIRSTVKAGHPEWSLKLVTLTRSVGLSDCLGEEAKYTLEAAHKLYKKLWGKEDGAGAIACLEVGERGHKVHVHLIVWGGYVWKSRESERVSLAERGLPIPEQSNGKYVSETWQKLTGDYIVDVQKTTPSRAIREVLKYITKFANLAPAQLVELHQALKGTRRIRAWGCFYDVETEEGEVTSPQNCPKCGAELTLTTEADFVRVLLERQHTCKVDIPTYSLDLTDANKSPPKQLTFEFLAGLRPQKVRFD